MTETSYFTPLNDHTTADLRILAGRLPNIIEAAIDRYNALATQIKLLEVQGITNATPHYRDQKYLYLIHPTAPDGTRERKYIGADPQRQAAALAGIERHKQHQALTEEIIAARRKLEQALTSLEQAARFLNHNNTGGF